jgi:acyl carrier protein phosphodiesterase
MRTCSRERDGFANLGSMNFFAHAALAHELRAEPAFVLGAMLPDLCGFARVRLGGEPGGALGAGVRLHHASDAVFHAHRAFAARCASLAAALEARGVRRGPARGVAHVASELLLDGWLAREAGVPETYRAALKRAGELLGASGVAPALSAALPPLCARLHDAPLPEAYADADFVCERVDRALAARPYLALAPSELPALAPLLAQESAECASWAPAVLAGVRAAIGAFGAELA